MNNPEDRVVNFICDCSFWNWLQNRLIGCRACRRYDTEHGGWDDGKINNRIGDEFATSYGQSRPMRESGGRGSDVSDDRLSGYGSRIASRDRLIQQNYERSSSRPLFPFFHRNNCVASSRNFLEYKAWVSCNSESTRPGPPKISFTHTANLAYAIKPCYSSCWKLIFQKWPARRPVILFFPFHFYSRRP